ncbi:MAG: hypothetical protein IJR19_05500 [Lachnospiraceae bacterium]|nr:hypothetical protein [Lachnospiraceae bacterium]MBQ9444065.1 hypothetical protein [Lachnospiraceae bacterium]
MTAATWDFSAFGLMATANDKHNGFRINDDGSVSVWSVDNSGKLNLPSTDGLSFYYTKIPSDKFFSLTATVSVDEWTFTNGQEGFGLMAADRVGEHGYSGPFWNNSYMAVCGRLEYHAKPREIHAEAPLIQMKLGIGAREKTGLTAEMLPKLSAGIPDEMRKAYITRMFTLERSCESMGEGIYNLFGNESRALAIGTVDNPLTEVTLRIRRKKDGYEISRLDTDGKVMGTKNFRGRDALSVLDKEYIYVGLFAARSCRVTFRDIELTLSEDHQEESSEIRINEYIYPHCRLLSSTVSNRFMYMLSFMTNADGECTIVDRRSDKVLNSIQVKAETPVQYGLMLEKNDNPLRIVFAPRRGYHPDGDPEIELISDEPVDFDFTVSHISSDRRMIIYVSPDGRGSAAGTPEDPIDIHTAVTRVKAGQEIVLLPGRYYPHGTIFIERDVSGVEDGRIVLRTTENGRAVIDFEKLYDGFVLAGSYWDISGIDVVNSAPFSQGLRICGHDITISDVRAYDNGETGIMIETLLDTDTREKWPHDILVRNCISLNNCDPGETNADGFAAKVTSGPGIIFDNCISCFNADDGWDLFAKPESGITGPVIIKNCIAFRNGYDLKLKKRGNGNGFKLGGTGIPVKHCLYNCVSWHNCGKGIDTNTNPKAVIKRCISFDNQDSNVGLYTSATSDTEYAVYSILSYRTKDISANDITEAEGCQDIERLINSETFYWRQGESENSRGIKVRDSWFEDLQEPIISEKEPLCDLEGLIGNDGMIDLGRFLKLSQGAREVLGDEW